jgi:hypothetical protein
MPTDIRKQQGAKMRRIGRPSPALVVAIAALVMAMAGTGYAALKLPRHSVGHSQLKRNAVTSVNVKDRSLLARDFKAGQVPSGKGGSRGARGPRGRTGARGPQGIPGPTAVTASPLGDPPGGVGTFNPIASATITTTVTGRLLVEGTVPVSTLTCGSPGCTESYELFVDGSPIPRTTYTQPEGSSAVTIAGIRDGVTAGAHTVELRSAPAGSVGTVTAPAAQVRALLGG